MDSSEDIISLMDSLEQQELASNGDGSADLYKQLLTLYLIKFDTVNAKFLWKRIPDERKKQGSELLDIWKVGKLLWKRDFPNAITAVTKSEWSILLQPLMLKLNENIRVRLIELIDRAYSHIMVNRLSVLLGMDEKDIVELAMSKSWQLEMDNKLIKIQTRKDGANNESLKSDVLLGCLTDYITFLEN